MIINSLIDFVSVKLPYPMKPLEQIIILQPFPSVFILLGTFLHHKSYRRIFKVNTNENIENMDVCDFIQGTLQTLTPTPQRTTSYIGHSNQYTRSPFLHTTQLQAKTTPQMKNSAIEA